MKKALIVCVMVLGFALSLSSCYQDFYYDSLDEYIKHYEENKCGFSVYELDHPEYFLPSETFIKDFEYIEGDYFFYEEDPLRFDSEPSVSLLYLKYNKEAYNKAKVDMQKNIPVYGKNIYKYDGYVFYENENFVEINEESYFPGWFTMACYNDENQTLIFIGFHEGTQDVNTIDDWKSFIDTYYGKYYDFNK